MKAAKAALALLCCLGALAGPGAAGAAAEFGFEAFDASFHDPAEAPLTQAGAHADFTTDLAFNTTTDPAGEPIADEELRDLTVRLPPGFAGNPRVAAVCTNAELVAGDGFCDPAAQVGVLKYELFPGFLADLPVYNMETPSSRASVLAMSVFGVPVRIVIAPRTDGDYGLTATLQNINQSLIVRHTILTLWGVPADPIHDPLRLKALFEGGLPAGIDPKPYLSLPTRCGESLSVEAEADSWQHPGSFIFAADESPALGGCDLPEFDPSLDARPTTREADSPSGLELTLRIPQNDDPAGLASAQLRKASVTLPESLILNPSSANGLEACAPAQIGLNTAPGSAPVHFDKAAPSCPDGSRIGSIEVQTPAFADPLTGSVYLASPEQNPFGSLLAIYLVLEGHGLEIKLPGEITADPETGRLRAVFDQNPQLPFEELRLSFFKGAAAPLKTRVACGGPDPENPDDPFTVYSDLVPWTGPEGATRRTADSFSIDQGAGGGPCLKDEASAPKAPGFEAGTANSTAGAYAPFTLKIARADGTQQLGSIDATLPPGLLAKLAGASSCSDAALAAAARKSGRAERADPSCPAASRVGSVTVGAGAGPKPYLAQGSAYLAGPYRGAPLSLAVIVPALAGPFDLGTVVVRNALFVDPVSAAVRALSDPLPRILREIPLDLRSIELTADRPKFTKNPTSCAESAITGSLLTLSGQSAPLFARFQVGGCAELGFKPKLRLALKGPIHRRAHPSLRATLTARPGEANIARAQVKLPGSAFLDNAHIGTPCTRVQFAAATCPEGSIIGKARATSPLLDYDVAGPVYLRTNPAHKLPDLVAALRGPEGQPIAVELAGKTDSVKGALRNTFEAVPDVPVTKFSLELFGGKRGLIVMSSGFCSAPRAGVRFDAQNGKTYDTTPRVVAKCPVSHKGEKPHR